MTRYDTELAAKLAGIGTALTEIYRSAAASGGTTEDAAEALARARLAAARPT